MFLEIMRHDGPARLGKIHHENERIWTPNLLWHDAAGEGSPEFLSISSREGDASIVDHGTIFSGKEPLAFGILPSMPTGYSTPKEVAENAVELTLTYAKSFPGYGAVIEGGRYHELRLKCAREFRDRPLLKIGQGQKLLENHRKLVEVLTGVRDVINPNTALYMPFAPSWMFPLLVYMGVDLFDLKKAVLDAHLGVYHTLRGGYELPSLKELPCSCPECLTKDPEGMTIDSLIRHNVNIGIGMIRLVRASLRRGDLRNLVEEWAATNAVSMGALRILDHDHGDFLEKYTGVF